MSSASHGDLIGLLGHQDPQTRMLTLHQLAEGLVDEPSILRAVVAGWDEWGAEEAFPEFPMLSFVPMDSGSVQEVLQRAQAMATGPLTGTSSRCAGKLVEQLMRLPARELAPWLDKIEAVVQQSKIFFRVDIDEAKKRIEFADLGPSELASALDGAIAELSQSLANANALQIGLRALEALRREHPQELDLTAVLQHGPDDGPTQAAGFQLTLQSLIHFPQSGLEPHLANYLQHEQEGIHSITVEALVRCGSVQAANALLSQFSTAEDQNRKWIVRGMQRLRIDGLAPRLGQLRRQQEDPWLWLMMLVAEARQLDNESADALATDTAILQSHSKALVDALTIYCTLLGESSQSSNLQEMFEDYLKRAQR